MDIKTVIVAVLALAIGVFFGSYYQKSRVEEPTISPEEASAIAQDRDLSLKTGEDFEKAYVEQMIARKYETIKIAEQGATKATRPELKQFSQDLIDSEGETIEKLENWLESWFGVKG